MAYERTPEMPDHTQRKDRYGLPITTSSTLAAERFIEGIDLLLEQNFGPEEQFTQAIEADAGFALAHGALAYMLNLRAQVAEARECAQQAQSLATGVSRRERQQIEAIALFINGQGPRSYALIREHLADYPRDMLMIRLAQRLFVLGCSGAGVASFPAVLLALMQRLESAYGDDWAFLGQYAFAHHETGYVEEARRLAERSLALRPTNAIAAHSVAHVFFETGDSAGGGDFLGTWLKGFDRRAPYRVHLSWHQALFELAMGHYQRVLNLYEEDIRPAVVAHMVTTLNDSAALLWRWYIYSGATPPVPPEEVRDLAAPAATRPGPAFRDAHAALAFAVAGDAAYMGQMIDRLRGLADQGDALAGEVTLPLVRGIHAFAHGAYSEAVRLMAPLFDTPRLDQLSRIGGSHAQREVFEDTMLEAYLRAEQFDKAEEMLRTRLQRRASVRDLFWLGRAQVSGGQPEAARASLREVTQIWQDADPGSPERTTLNHLTAQAG
jgi:tetratricopeptide (TPR) repeat protein